MSYLKTSLFGEATYAWQFEFMRNFVAKAPEDNLG